METILVNISGGSVRRERFNGRSYLVAPMTLLVGGQVLNGSKGPLLYPAEEVAKRPGMWNHTPITNGHPVDSQGRAVSARSPQVLEQYQLGFVFNDHWDGKARVAEGWFDEVLTKNKSPKTYQALAANRSFDLSTGLMTNNIPVRNGSQSNGKPYTHIATAYENDHVASLIDQVGACSRKDGCGVLIGNEACPECGKVHNSDNSAGIERTEGSYCPKCSKQHASGTSCEKEGGLLPATNEEKKSIWKQFGEYLGITDNAFCPSGKGGGQDNSCASKQGGGGASGSIGRPDHSQMGRYLSHDEAKGNAKAGDTPFIVRDKAGKTVGLAHDEKFAASEAQKHGGKYSISKWKKTKKQVQNTELQEDDFELDDETPTDNALTQTEGDDMSTKKEELVSFITTNCSCYKGKEKILNGFDEETLQGIRQHEEEATQNALVINALREDPDLEELATNELPAAFAKKTAAVAPAQTCPKCGQPMGMNHVCAPPTGNRLAPASQRLTPEEIEVLEIARETVNTSRAQLLDIVVNANAKDEASKKAIRPLFAKLGYRELKTIASNLPKPGTQVENSRVTELFDYFGAAGGVVVDNRVNNEVDPNDVLEPVYNAPASKS